MESHRDFRSFSKESKRDKNSNTKWKYGSRSSAGIRLDYVTREAVGGNEGQRTKIRPIGKNSDRTHGDDRSKGSHPNIVKPRCSGNWWSSQSRVRDVVYAQEEIKDSLRCSVTEMLPSESITQAMRQDEFMYSFDRSDSPNQPVALDIFVKTNGRETERLVQKEYEVLDLTGEALKGRKARSDLRKPVGPSLAEIVREDDDFELV